MWPSANGFNNVSSSTLSRLLINLNLPISKEKGMCVHVFVCIHRLMGVGGGEEELAATKIQGVSNCNGFHKWIISSISSPCDAIKLDMPEREL